MTECHDFVFLFSYATWHGQCTDGCTVSCAQVPSLFLGYPHGQWYSEYSI